MRRCVWITAAVLAGLVVGCRTDDQYAWDYGRSFHTVFESQKIAPTVADDKPMLGMDGTVAAAAYTRYKEAKPESKDKPSPTILQFQKGQ